MSGAVAIRPARRGDAAAVAAVHVETWRNAYAGIIPDAYLVDMTPAIQTERWKGHITSSGASDRILVAEADGVVVGFVSFGPTRFRTLAFAAEVYALYVGGDWQNRGIGRRLMTAAFEAAVTDGHAGALVWVLAENPARFFYEALGGRAVGQRREAFAGTMLREQAYGWDDLRGWLASRA